MTTPPLIIWSNAALPAPAMARLRDGLGRHAFRLASSLNASNLAEGGPDAALAEADVAFGQPDPAQVIELPHLRWIHLTTAGYSRYDTGAVRSALAGRGAALTTSSGVYAEPCAQHALAMVLALARQLPSCLIDQLGDHPWRQVRHRAASRLLNGQTVLLFGFGSIARRLAELLRPLEMNLIGVRRSVRGDEPIPMTTIDKADPILPEADHVISILPAADSTEGYFNADRFASMKEGAHFYNIGRGATVDQDALLAALRGGRLGGAYLDVTDPEPLPSDHPLWTAPRCHITPHSAGGHATEFLRLVDHFLANLRRFEAGRSLFDRII